jgi:hypothetical protein
LLLLKNFKISVYSLHCSASLDVEIQIPWLSYKVLHPAGYVFSSDGGFTAAAAAVFVYTYNMLVYTWYNANA